MCVGCVPCEGGLAKGEEEVPDGVEESVCMCVYVMVRAPSSQQHTHSPRKEEDTGKEEESSPQSLI